MTMRLTGRTALITGGNGGIGLAIARAYAREGASLIIAGTNPAKLAAAQEELSAVGAPVTAIRADVSARDECRRLADEAVAVNGRIDVLVNGAGVYLSRRFGDYTAEEFTRIMDVNTAGPFHLCQAVLPVMVEQGYGRVINIASSAGKWASRNQAVYNMSKHALIGMTRCLAMEYAAHAITVNALCPGLVRTDMSAALESEQAAAGGVSPEQVHQTMVGRIAIGRYLEAEECGPLAVLLASEESAGMTGQSIMVDGGMIFV
jgi:NAD(P)-dependent dehydrogenase (short-subunit alcohol dehydrogenase family)